MGSRRRGAGGRERRRWAGMGRREQGCRSARARGGGPRCGDECLNEGRIGETKVEKDSLMGSYVGSGARAM